MTDIIIVGGSYAGLAAAMQLGRARRSVLVVDAGQRRNRFVSLAHGVLGFDVAGLLVLPHTRLPGAFAQQLGCELESGPTGLVYKTDPRTKETTVKGVYAAGDAGQTLHSVTFAMADGARAGISAHQSLVFGQEPRGPNARATASD
jgi:thioredoxin reductase